VLYRRPELIKDSNIPDLGQNSDLGDRGPEFPRIVEKNQKKSKISTFPRIPGKTRNFDFFDQILTWGSKKHFFPTFWEKSPKFRRNSGFRGTPRSVGGSKFQEFGVPPLKCTQKKTEKVEIPTPESRNSHVSPLETVEKVTFPPNFASGMTIRPPSWQKGGKIWGVSHPPPEPSKSLISS